jgi:predicted dehydrogenase
MFELGCHLIDAVVTVLGKPANVAAYSRSSSPLNDGFLDNGMAVFEYPKATVTVRSAFLEVEGGARRQFVVCGTKVPSIFALSNPRSPGSPSTLNAANCAKVTRT